MNFKIKTTYRLLFITVFGVVFYAFYIAGTIRELLNVSRLVELLVLFGLFLGISTYILYFDETYTIKDVGITIKKGRSVTSYKISDIDYIYYKTFDRSGGHLSFNMNEAHLVIGTVKVSINTFAVNKGNKSLVDILNKKYHKRIEYDNSVFKKKL